MRLVEILEILPDSRILSGSDIEFSGVSHDSRKVREGDLFVCIKGFKSDGHLFIEKAIKQGAVAVVLEELPSHLSPEVPVIQVRNSRSALACISAHLNDYPARDLLTIGVTGTNGKTSITYLCESILREVGYNPGIVGTISAKVGSEERTLSNTTPESLELQELLGEMRSCKNDSVIMEVSSHALALNRVETIAYDVGVFTNLSQDHLDFHDGMEDYFKTKCKLFNELGTQHRSRTAFAIVNADDPYGQRILSSIRVPFISYGFGSQSCVRASCMETHLKGTSFLLQTPVGERQVHLNLAGEYNVLNALAAVAVALSLRIELEHIVVALEKVRQIPGRFQLVQEGQEFGMVVDYAHTPDGLESLLKAARKMTQKKVHVVFGCGGDRDRLKRPMMGKVATRLADRVTLTNDNPRSEYPAQIVADIQEGIADLSGSEKRASVEVELDRRSAIFQATYQAQAGDVIVIAGKGHETYQIIGDRRMDFDDVSVAREALLSLQGRMGKLKTSRTLSQEKFLDRRFPSGEFNAISVGR